MTARRPVPSDLTVHVSCYGILRLGVWSCYAACDDLATHLWLIPLRHSGSIARAKVIDLE